MKKNLWKLKIKSCIIRKNLFEKHNSTIVEVDRVISANELVNGLSGYRKIIAGMAEGNVLETCTGSFKNLRFYNQDKVKKITAIDYSPNAIELALNKDTKDLEVDFALEDVEK